MCLIILGRVFADDINYETTIYMSPFADMFNHKRSPKQCHWHYDNEKKGFAIKALRPIEAGEEVFLRYGCDNNSRFFVDYGFLNEDKKYDKVMVVVDSGKTVSSLKYNKEKQNLIGKNSRQSFWL